MDLSLFLPPLVACLIIVAIHSYLGLHVHRARGDLRGPLAGPDGGAGLGGGGAGGQAPDSTRGFLYALGFTTHRRGALRR